MSAALEASGLGKRYGRNWALKDCNLTVPRGRIAALVGPNGAGKTTLLHLAVGLLAPTTGAIRVLDHAPGDAGLLARVGFVAQDTPVYRDFTAAEHLTLGRKLNPSFDEPRARGRLERLAIPLDRRVGELSGGQRAQVALALALAAPAMSQQSDCPGGRRPAGDLGIQELRCPSGRCLRGFAFEDGRLIQTFTTEPSVQVKYCGRVVPNSSHRSNLCSS